MKSAAPLQRHEGARFRRRLTTSLMLVVLALVALAFYLAQRYVGSEAQRALRSDFQAELESLHNLQNLRNSALSERCRALVAKPRIHAALEDNALDLLYPSAKDELRDLMAQPEGDATARVVHAHFYRFLDSNGRVLAPLKVEDTGELDAAAQAAVALNKLPATPMVGYLPRHDLPANTIDEMLAMPIFSSETGEVISALVVGFKPLELRRPSDDRSLTSGIWIDRELHMATLPASARPIIAEKIERTIATAANEGNFRVHIEREPHLLFYKLINPGSAYPAAYEIAVYPLAFYVAWEKKLRWQIAGGGLIVLLAAVVTSRIIAARLARPVQQLALVSEQEQIGRARAEAALETTSEELERTARYSADASHQLKSPVTVLRVGLETLLRRDDLKPEVYDELSALLHQTYRLTGVIDDLLLLARMDAGRLQLQSEPVDLGSLIDEWLDDFSAMPDGLDLETKCDIAPDPYVAGDRPYLSLILQNLLENARKYNRPGGRIEIRVRKENGMLALTIGNTGRSIPAAAQAHLFQRFQRGSGNGDVPGHGLGLNLARELARLHGGELRLVRSDKDWTEFEVRFRSSPPAEV